MTLQLAAEVELRHLREVDLTDMMAQAPVTLPFALYPLIPCRQVTLLGGHGGAGKSMLALILAAHFAGGKTWAGIGINGGRAVYVSLEDPGDLVRYRLRRICEAYGLDPIAVAKNLSVLDGSGGDAALVTEIADGGVRRLTETALMQEVDSAASGAALLIIDNASDAFDGDENARRQVRQFLRRLTDIASVKDCALVLLAHIDKRAAIHGSSGNSYTGSTAWHNSVRSRLAITVNEDGTILLSQEKLNLANKAEPATLFWNEAGVLMPRVYDPLAPDPMANRNVADDNVALSVMRAALSAGMIVPTGTGGVSTAWHAVEHLPEMIGDLKLKSGKGRFHTALVRLERDGYLQRAPFKDRHRNARERWELTQDGEKITAQSALRYSPIPPAAVTQRGPARYSVADSRNASVTHTHATDAANDYRATRDGGF